MLYRPLFPGTAPEEKARHAASHEVDLDRESTWISYRPISLEAFQPSLLDQFSHHRLATPISPWECLKIGCGTPPILTRHGWLVVYHGVSEIGHPSNGVHRLDARTSTEEGARFGGWNGLGTNVSFCTSRSTSNRLLVAQT
jgi:hypothetical protein